MASPVLQKAGGAAQSLYTNEMKGVKMQSPQEAGFTLMELMVSIAIIAILTGIAIPTFLSQQHKANDLAVTSDLNSVAMRALSDWTLNSSTIATFVTEQPRSKGVTIQTVAIDSKHYCIAAFHDLGKEYNEDNPLIFDSSRATFTAKNEGKSSSCDSKF